MRRFPLRTLLLMLVALLAFTRLWCVTHQDEAAEAPPARPPAQATTAAPAAPSTPPPSPECRQVERALDAALRAPQEPTALAEARKRLDACVTPPPRACELGTALAARAPFSQGADTPLRGLLASLCEHCPPNVNACAQTVSRALLETAIGQPANIPELQWSMDHAGPALPAACDTLARLGLAPAAQAEVNLPPTVRTLVDGLVSHCQGPELLPLSVLRAAAAQQGTQAPALLTAASAKPVESAPVKPDQLLGAQPAFQAFDGDVVTGVDVSNATKGDRWSADGALRAGYAPTLKHLMGFRVRARGPGTLRAIVRTPKGVGLNDPEGGFSFVNPTVCRFRGTGEWESCHPAAPLVDVDAVSVFPESADGKLLELEILGAR
ncbi:hypothetical protein [Myxococcus qinghaiensis]|uniref:hypothetical protein n=1 Tax=Myxococcus qinghaiensis TaxID=2906758 RepID=UPI0020A7F70E|nr:hypothetical protein [Myxococcus qinghaiensis]MCP3164233.1 hypothetical protein [Myxococcus qinghaiensis]